MSRPTAFKAYDVRGRLGAELDEGFAQRLGQAVAGVLPATTVVMGRDVRPSSPALAAALAQGLCAGGARVIDIGLCGTEEVYFATDHLRADAGIMVTASHNPIDYNGFKFVGPGAAPLTGDAFEALARETGAPTDRAPPSPGMVESGDFRRAFVERVCAFAKPTRIGPLRVAVNAGYGCAGPVIDAILGRLIDGGARLEVARLNHQPDPTFPAGIPNPLIPANQHATSRLVRSTGADIGIAWDGDFDRCFFFDETGAFLAGEHVVSLLASAALRADPGGRIVHDNRVIWSTRDAVLTAGGTPVQAPTGHAFIKARMRDVDAVYGGEMSAHHYFRDFMYCDSGMIPMVLMLEMLSSSGMPLSALVGEMRARFPSSGETNFQVPDTARAIAAIEDRFGGAALDIDRLDGLSLNFGDWRLNLRASNTEPLLRLNIETRGEPGLLAARYGELTAMIADLGGAPG